jgi:hypothetical protein
MGRMLAVLGLAVALVAGATLVAGPRPAAAQRIEDDAEARAYWQGRYRDLRMKEARLVQTVKLATKEYADANRRTYRRSGVRHFHRTNANDAKAELELVRADLETIYDDARSAGIPIFWLDEVAEEPIDMDRVEGLGVYADGGPFGGKGAYAKDTAEDDAEAGPDSTDDGRNPLHAGEGDEPASLDDTESKRFDYEAWRKDRWQYEKDRAPERHLDPDDLESDEEP